MVDRKVVPASEHCFRLVLALVDCRNRRYGELDLCGRYGWSAICRLRGTIRCGFVVYWFQLSARTRPHNLFLDYHSRVFLGYRDDEVVALHRRTYIDFGDKREPLRYAV